MTRFRYIFLVLFSLLASGIKAQELRCDVQVNATGIETTQSQVFKTLENAISEYMNTNSFTRNNFNTNEKIDCRLFFNIKGYNNDHFTAELQVQSLRPVFNSTYTTTLLNFKDNKVSFDYYEYEPLEFSQTSNISELTSILNFYAYLILALDYDSFSPKGGQDFYDRARAIVMEAQNSNEEGWKMFQDNRNRAAVLSTFTDAPTSAFRDLYYDYHRNGLDEMAGSPAKARKVIYDIINNNLTELNAADPFSAGISIFHDAKLDEIIGIFSEAPAAEKTKVKEILEDIYPADRAKLREIEKN